MANGVKKERGTANKGWLMGAGAVMFLGVLAVAVFIFLAPKRDRDREFDGGSGIRIEAATDVQQKNLAKLCHVWGFAKYHHPAVIAGDVNWDYELFRVMPRILSAEDETGANELLASWLTESLGEAVSASAPARTNPGSGSETSAAGPEPSLIQLEPDTGWIHDGDSLGEHLSSLLVSYDNARVADFEKGYAAFSKSTIYVDMKNENPYPAMGYDDDGYRLLGLFRYWNIIEYFYPYRNIIGEDWDGVLAEFIPKFLNGGDESSYKLACAELTTRIHDTHAVFSDPSNALIKHFGENVAPVKFITLDGKIVIEQIAPQYAGRYPLRPGDIVTRLDGSPIEDVILDRQKYISLSDSGRFDRSLNRYLFRTPADSLSFTVIRESSETVLSAACYEESDFSFGKDGSSHRLLEGGVGYIDPGYLKRGELRNIMKKFENAPGLIVDLRSYPSDAIVYMLADYLLPEPTPFALFSYADRNRPGGFSYMHSALVSGRENPDYYLGKVVILMNQNSISQSEFTVMSLRNAPDAVVLGSPSCGADGNVVTFSLPGGVRTAMTGLGIFYPDKSPTQRVGLEPDIYFTPTVEGVLDGRDELTEKAVNLILKN